MEGIRSLASSLPLTSALPLHKTGHCPLQTMCCFSGSGSQYLENRCNYFITTSEHLSSPGVFVCICHFISIHSFLSIIVTNGILVFLNMLCIFMCNEYNMHK